MARSLYGVEKGLRIYDENANTAIDFLTGTAAPDGLGDQASADIGSLYVRRSTGQLYQKIANAGNSADWELNGPGSALTRWRPELVDVLTDDTQGAGVRDVVANPFSDDDDGLVPGDFNVGHYIISDADGTPALLEITNVSGDDVTFAVAGTALVDGDAFVVEHYLPDPAGQEAQAIVVFSGGVMVKIADVNWGEATGIVLSSNYAAAIVNGDPAAGDTVEKAIGNLDANQDDLTTLSGVAQGSTDLGTFTGSTIPDGQNNKQAFQALETAHEEVDQNVDDLITLSGRPENSTDQGAMPGDILSDGATNNALFQEVDNELTRQRGASTGAAITAIATVDSVLVDDVAGAQWHIVIENAASPTNKKRIILDAFHNGHAAGDATATDDDVSSSKRIGPNFNSSVSVDLNGAAGAQEMRLRVTSTEPGGVNVYAKRIETLF